jgi:hypothetical protein
MKPSVIAIQNEMSKHEVLCKVLDMIRRVAQRITEIDAAMEVGDKNKHSNVYLFHSRGEYERDRSWYSAIAFRLIAYYNNKKKYLTKIEMN